MPTTTFFNFFFLTTQCARRPEARACNKQMLGQKLAPNGRLPATLRLAIRANPSTRGFAARRNVAEAERAICERSEAEKAH
jgi:hypothetical protein